MRTTTASALSPRPIAPSVDELLAPAERLEPFDPVQRRSNSRFQRVWIDGAPYVVKYLHRDHDFMLRALGDDGSRTLRAFGAGLFDAAPDAIDHAMVGAAPGAGDDGTGCAFLMRDVSGELVPPGDDVFPEAHHRSFVEHLARLCASTWGWRDTLGLAPYEARWTFTGHRVLENERRRDDPERVVQIVARGVAQFSARAPHDVATGVDALRHDIGPLAAALQQTPSCFLHGDWKASNLGTAADGRTILIDWVYLGEGPACHELGWYLALNRQKLPTSKEQAISDFRSALERNGVETAGWWERQLRLALLGTVVQHGWEKALGDDEEFGWWCDRAREGLALL
jgi:aminoglycoside phosphotransferase (APT) family kinase protein